MLNELELFATRFSNHYTTMCKDRYGITDTVQSIFPTGPQIIIQYTNGLVPLIDSVGSLDLKKGRQLLLILTGQALLILTGQAPSFQCEGMKLLDE